MRAMSSGWSLGRARAILHVGRGQFYRRSQSHATTHAAAGMPRAMRLEEVDLVEANGRDSEPSASPGVSRGQNVAYVVPHDASSIARFLAPMLERAESIPAELQIVVVTPDADD